MPDRWALYAFVAVHSNTLIHRNAFAARDMNESDVSIRGLKMKKKRNNKIDMSMYGYFFISPFFIIFTLFMIYPIFNTILLSFVDLKGFMWMEDVSFVGFENYEAILTNEKFYESLLNTLMLWGFAFIPQVLVPLMLAKWFSDIRMKIKGQGAFKAVFFAPNIITAASVSVLFASLFAYPTGPVNQILVDVLRLVDEPINFYRSAIWTRGIVSFTGFWMWYGYVLVLMMSAIIGINPALYEAGRIDGASSGQMFRKITLPLIRPVMIYFFITSLIGGMQMFDIPFLLTFPQGQGSPDGAIRTVTMFIYNKAFLGARVKSEAAAASILLFIVIVILSALMFRVMRDRSDDTKVKRRPVNNG